MKILIIGGVAAGTKVAAKLKRENRDYDVTILTKSKDISYAGCGLPYYVGNLIQQREQLIVNTPASSSALTGATVLTETEVIKINRDQKTIEAKNLTTKELSTHSYDKLVIASGASPIKPAIDGVNLDGVYYMRTPEDAIELREAVEAGKIKRAVVVGGGFIGLEVAENLSHQGVRVSVIDMADHILPGFDPEFAEYVENHLADHGIMAMTNTRLEAILGEGKVEKVQTGKRAIKCDAVILAMGIRANTFFAKDTGLELMNNQTIKVNEYLMTNDPDIYAVGDCACVSNAITKESTWSPMGSSANIEGRIAARNIVDIAVTAITMKAALEDIENMDLAYAPPFSTAIHPFSHTVNVLLNKISGAFNTITPTDYMSGMAEGYTLIDASITPSITGATYMDLTKVTDKVPDYSLDDKLLLVCTKGKRAYLLQNRLKHFGYKNTLVLEGGSTFNSIKI